MKNTDVLCHHFPSQENPCKKSMSQSPVQRSDCTRGQSKPHFTISTSYFNNDSIPVTQPVWYVGRARTHRWGPTLLWRHSSHKPFFLYLPPVSSAVVWMRNALPYSWDIWTLIPTGGAVWGGLGDEIWKSKASFASSLLSLPWAWG